MNKYSDKSDFEINKAVAVSLSAEFQFDDIREKLYTDILRNTEIDYCNNPADAMPIVIESGISLINDSGKLFAAAPGCGVEGYLGNELCGYGSSNYSESDNIYRAAMEVFLMMKDADK